MSRLKVPLVIAFTPNYLVPAATCLLSILEHSNREDEYEVICLLTDNFEESCEAKLKLIDTNNQLSFTFINLKDELKGVYVDEKYTIAASYRLLVPEILPEYDTVIYLDCDIIVRNNLASLYHSANLQNNYMAAVYEAPMDFQVPHIVKLGCETAGGYFNSGFLVMNLKQLRLDNMTEKFIKSLTTDYLEFPDQDVLNMLCRHRTLGLPPRYNSIRTFFLPQYKKYFLKRYSEMDWLDVQERSNIHYTGGKPWNQFTVKFTEWWDFFEKLPKEIKREWKVNMKIFYLYKFHKTAIGSKLIPGLQKLYRRLNSDN